MLRSPKVFHAHTEGEGKGLGEHKNRRFDALCCSVGACVTFGVHARTTLRFVTKVTPFARSGIKWVAKHPIYITLFVFVLTTKRKKVFFFVIISYALGG